MHMSVAAGPLVRGPRRQGNERERLCCRLGGRFAIGRQLGHGLIAQGLSLYDAARIGVWLCGRAAEICVFEKNSSEESLLPGDVLDNLGAVLNLLRGSIDAPRSVGI